MKLLKTEGSVTLVLGGEAGQGIQLIEKMLTFLVKRSGLHVFTTKEYESRIRGGINTTEIRVGNQRLRSHVHNIDILIPLKAGVIEHLGDRVSESTLIIGDKDTLKRDNTVDIKLKEEAEKIGNKLFANSIALGLLCAMLQLDQEVLFDLMRSNFSDKGEDIISNNIEAAKQGMRLAAEKGLIPEQAAFVPQDEIKHEIAVSGADAIALGAIAGGCDSCFSYPMTPGTSVFTLLAEWSAQHPLLVEQVEDEISAVNMALGSWYAGARPMVSTSGGGFALMTEGVSLAGMLESPLVVHLAQRPGPATGLPTRTEQGDLNLVRYAGHGEFSRIILAPGTVEQGYALAKYSYEAADRYQVPVFLLTDQYYVDTIYNCPAFDGEITKENHIVETGEFYNRYTLADDGISLRGIPGYGKGVVCVDSDEHDESGRITEDLDGVHMDMAKKRMLKCETVKKAALEPELIGPEDYKTLLVGWGSTYSAIKESLGYLQRDDVAFLFAPQVYPLPASYVEYLKRAEKIIDIENNQLGQFCDLIRIETGIEADHKILKYNGMPFAVEELVEKIGALL